MTSSFRASVPTRIKMPQQTLIQYGGTCNSPLSYSSGCDVAVNDLSEHFKQRHSLTRDRAR